MLKFQWNSLRRGDTVFAHDTTDPNEDCWHCAIANPARERHVLPGGIRAA